MNLNGVLPGIQWSISRLAFANALAAVAVLAMAAGFHALIPHESPLQRLELRGDFQRLQMHDVQAASRPFLGDGFFTTDVSGLRDSLSALPWVSEVRVLRRWPGDILVRVEEREPFARWNDSDMLDRRARVFQPRPADIPSGLPRLSGRDRQAMEVKRTWTRLARELEGTRLQLVELHMGEQGQWRAVTRDGVELRFGKASPDQRLPVLRDVVDQALVGRWSQVRYIDLRYTNGFAVAWRDPGEAPGAEQ